MKIKYFYIIVLVLASSCGQSVVSTPEKMLSEQQMEDLMYDLAIIDGIRIVDNQLLDSLKVNPDEFIYKKHHIDSLSLVENMVYYASFPKKYNEIINKVDSRLKKEREALLAPPQENNKLPEAKVIDSIELKKVEPK